MTQGAFECPIPKEPQPSCLWKLRQLKKGKNHFRMMRIQDGGILCNSENSFDQLRFIDISLHYFAVTVSYLYKHFFPTCSLSQNKLLN